MHQNLHATVTRAEAGMTTGIRRGMPDSGGRGDDPRGEKEVGSGRPCERSPGRDVGASGRSRGTPRTRDEDGVVSFAKFHVERAASRLPPRNTGRRRSRRPGPCRSGRLRWSACLLVDPRAARRARRWSVARATGFPREKLPTAPLASTPPRVASAASSRRRPAASRRSERRRGRGPPWDRRRVRRRRADRPTTRPATGVRVGRPNAESVDLDGQSGSGDDGVSGIGGGVGGAGIGGFACIRALGGGCDGGLDAGDARTGLLGIQSVRICGEVLAEQRPSLVEVAQLLLADRRVVEKRQRTARLRRLRRRRRPLLRSASERTGPGRAPCDAGPNRTQGLQGTTRSRPPHAARR